MTVPSGSFVVLVTIFIVVVRVLLRVIKKGSKTSGSGPQVHFHDEGKETAVIVIRYTKKLYKYKYKKQLQKIEKKVGMEYQKAYKHG